MSHVASEDGQCHSLTFFLAGEDNDIHLHVGEGKDRGKGPQSGGPAGGNLDNGDHGDCDVMVMVLAIMMIVIIVKVMV